MEKTVEAIVLAGGLGTRVRALTSQPKILIPVQGKPFIDYMIDYCAAQNVTRVWIAAGYRGADIEWYVQQRTWPIEVCVHIELEPQGTGGALRPFEEVIAEQFLVINGDTLLRADALAMMTFHQNMSASITVGVIPNVTRTDGGCLEITDLPGWVTRFSEKPGHIGTYMNAGIYAMNHEVIAALPAGPSSLERDVLPAWVDDKAVAAFLVESSYDIGTVERYTKINEKGRE